MKNALICFLKYPEPGEVKTRLAADIGDAGAVQLYESLVERIITEVYPLNAEYDLRLYVDPAHTMNRYRAWLGETWSFFEQTRGDLGHRMETAIQESMDAGYQNVLIIGTDCIGMNEEFIEEAFAKLTDHEFVIGPSSDGGYYLLGMNDIHPYLFYDMPWSTEEVYEITTTRMENRDLKFHVLEEKLDVDNLEDLQRLREGLPATHFLAHKIDQIILERLTPSEGAHDLTDLD